MSDKWIAHNNISTHGSDSIYCGDLITWLREENERLKSSLLRTPPRAEEVRLWDKIKVLDSRLAQAREAIKARLRAGHHDTCDELKMERENYACSCGHSTLVVALRALEEPK